jgi:hypothetical protein
VSWTRRRPEACVDDEVLRHHGRRWHELESMVGEATGEVREQLGAKVKLAEVTVGSCKAERACQQRCS